MSLRTITASLFTLAFIFVGLTSSAATTLDNLQAAYNGESNANAKYTEYAKKADEEGYKRVAMLFRAAAKAEELHARNHAEVIRSLGAAPKMEIKLPEIKTTADNLKDAIAGESYERDTMYPDFLKQARQERNKAAIRTFNFAKSAEAKHAALYKKALDQLDTWKTIPDGMVFYVCPKCGETVASPDYAKCPVCFTSTEEFIKIN